MEEIFIPLIVFSFIALIVKMSLDHGKWKRQHSARELPPAQPDNSLRVSELEEMLRQSVSDAIRPLEQRLERVERSLGEPDKRKVLDEKDPSS